MTHHIPKAELEFRTHQRRGAIMNPKTFEKIERRAEKEYGSKERAQKVAGAAYWKTLESKFKSKGGKK